MKNLSKIKAITLISFFLLFYGCKKETKKTDKCEGVICLNGGYCQDGSCNCPVGYSGKDCSIMKSDKYQGIYDVKDTGYFSWTLSSGTNPCFQTFIINRKHESTITTDRNDPYAVLISNFFGDGNTVTCHINASDDNKLYATNIPIKYGTCSSGYIKYDSNTRPYGYISADGKTITVIAKADIVSGFEHYVNNFVSTFTRK